MAHRVREFSFPVRDLFENHPLPMWVYDLETLAFLAVNAAAIRHYGYSRREFLAMTIKEIRPPEEIPALLEQVALGIVGHDSSGPWRHRKKDGTLIDVEIVSQTIRFAGRQAKLILANDISERSRLEREIVAAAGEWRQIFDAMSDAVALIDREGRISRCNRAMTTLVGKNYQSIVGRPCWDVVHGTTERVLGCPVAEAMTTLKRAVTTLVQGAQTFKVVADPIFDPQGRLIGAVHIMTDITLLERSEKILNELVLQQAAILGNIPDIAWLKDDQSRFVAVNEAFSRACGVAEADLVGKTDFDIWPRELAEGYQADDREVMRSCKRKIVEEPLSDNAGRVEWIESIKTPIVDEGGRVIGTAGIARDITERRRMEEQLRRKEYLLSSAQRIAHIGSWEADFTTGRVSWSDEMHRIYGTSPETFELTVASFMHIIHAGDRPAMMAWIRAATAGEEQRDLEFRAVRPDGSVRWVRGSVEPLRDAAGAPVGAVGTGQDITERRQAQEALQASERKFRTLFETANDAIFILDQKGNFVDFNIIAHERLGYSREEMLSKHISDLDLPEFAARVPERLALIRKEGHAVFESAHLRKDGSVMPVEISSRLIEYEGQRVYFSIVRDVSERKKTAAALREQQAFTESILQGSSVATFVLNDRHEVVLWNRACEELTGTAATAILGTREAWKPFYDGPRPVLADVVLGKNVGENLSDLYPAISQSVLLPEGLHAERWVKNLNGRDRFIIFDAAPVRDSAGRIVAAIETLADITEQKKLQEQFSQISREWEETFNTLTDMVTVHDKDFNIIRANTAAEKILGLSFLEVKKPKCFEYFHGTTCPPAGCPSCDSLVTGKPSVNEIYEPHLGRHLEIRAIPRLDSDGGVVGLIHVVRDISERKREAETREQLTEIVEKSLNEIYIFDAKTLKFRHANRGALRNLQYSLEEIKTLTPLDLKPQHTEESFRALLQPLMTGEEEIHAFETIHRRADGSLYPVEVHLQMMSEKGEQVFLAFVYDITKRKKMEAALSESEERLRAIFDNTGEGILWADAETKKLLHGNRRICQMLGYSSEEMRNLSVMDIHPEEDLPFVLRQFERQARGEISLADNMPVRRKDGTVFYAAINASPVTLAGKTYITGFFTDITQRRAAEEALRHYSTELSALTDASNNLLALTSLADIYEGICRSAERVFDVELVWLGVVREGSVDVDVAASSGVGKEYLRDLKVTRDDSPASNGPTGMAIKTGEPRLVHQDSPEFAPWRAAAEKMGFEVSLAVPLISPAGTGSCFGALNFYSRLRDYFSPDKIRLCQIFANQAAIAIENARLISGLEEKVEERTREIEAANRAKSDFLANMSHELRTPMNAILGFSDLMLRGMAGPLEGRQKEYLGDILAGGKHLLSLINDILDLSKVEAGKMGIEPSEYDLAGLIDRSLVLFREKALRHGISLTTAIEETISPVFGDERKIRQVLYNLLSNAVKFTPDGGSVSVRVTTAREEGVEYAEVAIVDTGIGIAPEDQEQLFQPFRQIGHHLTKEYEGTGLGLALCKSFVEMHHGSIRLESAPGKGSTFVFRVPLRFTMGAS